MAFVFLLNSAQFLERNENHYKLLIGRRGFVHLGVLLENFRVLVHKVDGVNIGLKENKDMVIKSEFGAWFLFMLIAEHFGAHNISLPR